MDDNERPFKILVVGIFSLYLIMQGIMVKEMTYLCIAVGFLLVIGLVLVAAQRWQKRREMAKFEETFGVEDQLIELAKLVAEYHLEIRVRQNSTWDVTLFSTEDKLHRMMGKGRGETMSGAMEAARQDFLKKVVSS